MFNIQKVTDKLFGLVGFRQPLNPDYAILDADNLASRSGLYVNDNEFAKIEFIHNSQDYAQISDIDFNDYLKNKQKESIINVCNAVFDESDFIDRGLFFKYPQNKVSTETLPDGFVYYRISMSEDKNIAVNFKRVLLDFNGTGNITLYLFNTAKKHPLKSKLITITTDHQEVQLDWIIDNTDGIYKGDYFIGYFTQGLTVQPFKRDYRSSIILSSFTHLNIITCLAPSHTTPTLFDLLIEEYISETIGLNFDITVFDDYTDLIINNDFLFSRAILLDLQINCLSIILASLRSNHDERMGGISLSRILSEIEGQSGQGVMKIEGLRPNLVRRINEISEEIDRIESGYNGEDIFVDTLC